MLKGWATRQRIPPTQEELKEIAAYVKATEEFQEKIRPQFEPL